MRRGIELDGSNDGRATRHQKQTRVTPREAKHRTEGCQGLQCRAPKDRGLSAHRRCRLRRRKLNGASDSVDTTR